jgi:hypothetical protein
MEIQHPRLCQCVGIGPGPSPRAAPGFGRGAAGGGPRHLECPLHRRDGAHDGPKAAARGGRGLDLLPSRDERNPLRFEEPHDLESVRE